MGPIARWMIIVGVILVAIGVMLQVAPWLLNWFGRLPGDIHIETQLGKVFFPITSMLIISIVLSVIINLFR